MVFTAISEKRIRPAGFTLLELLLALALLLLLLGSLIFNYSALQRGAKLDEGATQLEGLFRFARAQAGASGRSVRIVFGENGTDLGGGSTPAATTPPPISLTPPFPQKTVESNSTHVPATIFVGWEADPFVAPGQFVVLPEARSYVDSLMEWVQIVEIRAANSSRLPVATGDNGESAPIPSSSANPLPARGEPSSPQVSGQISFYPDGSSDSIELVLGSQDEDDQRRLLISLAGITGRIRRRVLDPDEGPGFPPALEKLQPASPSTPRPAILRGGTASGR